MAELAEQAQHEFWRPPMQAAAAEPAMRAERVEACDRCGTEFIVGSRFCHTCGALRPGSAQASRAWLKTGLKMVGAAAKGFAGLGEQLGLPTASFLAFLAGACCVLGALAVGVIFSTQKLIDWQAVQMWRIEWLLGAIAMFAAGVLLKRSR
jgi:hypothetical protein